MSNTMKSHAALQSLEPRTLLSTAYDPATGLLTVNGTAGNDVIDVEWVADNDGSFFRTTVNGVVTPFSNLVPFPKTVIVNGGGGDDVIRTRTSGDFVINPDADIQLYGGDGNDRLELLAGAAKLAHGGAGDDTLLGGAGRDSLVGGDDNDELSGGDASDTLDGGDGRDTLYGGAGADALTGGRGNDILRGQDGDDTLVGDGGGSAAGRDRLDGGRGIDTADYSDRGTPLNLSLDGVANDGGFDERDDLVAGLDILLGGSDNDTLAGDDADNTLMGNAGGDRLSGGGGQDRLDGGDNNDDLFGDRGNDTLLGRGGRDALYGGRGDDLLDGGQARDFVVSGGAGADNLSEGLFEAEAGEIVTLSGLLTGPDDGTYVIEGTGWFLQAGADRDGIEVNVFAAQTAADRLKGRRVTITGRIRIAHGIERGDVRTLDAVTITPIT